MPRAINRRVTAAEQEARSRAPVFRIIRMRGGLPGPIRCASADGSHWQRLADEPIEVFEKRIIAAAESAKSKTLVIGGLCGCAWKTPASFKAYLGGPDFRQFDEDELPSTDSRNGEHVEKVHRKSPDAC
jgi:hypothetical protein